MKSKFRLNQQLFIAASPARGLGVFTMGALRKNEIIERSPVIVMNESDRALVDKTLLYNYIFEWGESRKQCCMAMGYVPIYNHSYQSNCEYEMDFEKAMITIKTVRRIEAGEELFINYNGNWNDGTPVWFDAT